ALAFSILYNIPRKTIIPAGMTGAIGWTSFLFFTAYLSLTEFLAKVISTHIIAFVSQILARNFRSAVIIFTLPCLISLVHGEMAYIMMRAFVEGNTTLGVEYGTSTFLTAGALALGLSINGALFQLFSSRDLFKRGTKYVP